MIGLDNQDAHAPAPVAGEPQHATPALWIIALLLLGLTLVVRLPFFFPAVINWDESTFILIGQNILNGNMPLVGLWDIKPPVGFLIFAAIIAALGQTILAVRLAGALFVAAAAVLVYLIGGQTWRWPAGLAAAVLFIFTATLMPSGAPAVMLEHLAIVPLLAAVLLLVARPPSAAVCFAAGVLFMLATMIRLNLALVAVFAGVYILLVPSPRPLAASFRRGLAFAAGNALVLALTFLPYWLAGEQAIWWSTLVVGPLQYNSSDSYMLMSVDSQREVILDGILHLPRDLGAVLSGAPFASHEVFGRPLLEEFAPSLLAMLLAGAGAGFVLAIVRRGAAGPSQKQAMLLIGLMLIGTELSVILTGKFSYHYLIQVVPFLSLFAGLFISELAASRAWPAAALATVVFLILAAGPLFGEYALLAGRVRAGLPLAHGPAYEVAAFLREDGAVGRPIYLMDDQIVYWFLGQEPLSRVTVHPSGIVNEGMLRASGVANPTPEAQLAYVLDQHPAYIVTRDDLWYLKGHPALIRRLKETLAADYELVKQVDVPLEPSPLDIYRRVGLP